MDSRCEIFTADTQIKKDITLRALWGADTEETGEYVVFNQTKNIQYKTLLNAVKGTQESEVIKLLSDCNTPISDAEDNIEYHFADGCTFDLNKYTLTNNVKQGYVTYNTVYTGKNITVQNGSINGDGNFVFYIGIDKEEVEESSFTEKQP